MSIVRRSIVALSGALVSVPACARGAPFDFIGHAAADLTAIAIAAGAVAGLLCGALRGTEWPRPGLLMRVALVIPACGVLLDLGLFRAVGGAFALSLHWLMLLLGCPLWTFVAMLLTAADIATDMAAGRRRGCAAPTGRRKAIAWPAGSHAFWCLVALANMELLVPLPLAPIMPSALMSFGRFLPFLLPPLGAAVLIAAACTFALRRRLDGATRYAAPLLFNAIFLFAFAAAAELHCSASIAAALVDRRPQRLEIRSFTASVIGWRGLGRSSHASFEEDGIVYRWSYAERRFERVPGAARAYDASMNRARHCGPP